ncbi:MAG TPA: DUF2935 domain-containing protein [Clostridia bacterium]
MTREQYIKQALELNIFFARIFKEHCVTLSAAQKHGDTRLLQALDRHKVHFEMLLNAALEEGFGLIDKKFIDRDCFVTPYTYSLELTTQSACGILINHKITNLEIERLNKPQSIPAGRLPVVYERALRINSDGEETAQGLAELMENILGEILKGRIYSSVYPSVYERYISELKKYQNAVRALKQDQDFDWFDADAVKAMRIYAEFVRNCLDFKEIEYSQKAHDIAQDFSQCESDREKFIKVNQDFSLLLKELIEKLLDKKLLCVMPPLTLDNILRQANRYIALLE